MHVNIKSRLKELLIGIFILCTAVSLVFYGQSLLDRTTKAPAWASDAVQFLAEIRTGIEAYQSDNQGRLPKSLKELYPQYVKNPHITREYVHLGGKLMWVTYHGSSKAGSSNSVIAEIRLEPGIKSDYKYRGSVLTGDMHVHPMH